MRIFKTPDELRKYVLSLSSELIAAGYDMQSNILASRANIVCTTGTGWLEVIREGVNQLRSMGSLPDEYENKLDIILNTSNSKTPYT